MTADFTTGVLVTLGGQVAAVFLIWFFGRALSRSHGTECLVCDHLQVDIAERRTLAYIWARKAWHRIWWRTRKWHRDGEAAYRAKWGLR